jgi:hypothetical protein
MKAFIHNRQAKTMNKSDKERKKTKVTKSKFAANENV